jgi:hypothetical protein
MIWCSACWRSAADLPYVVEVLHVSVDALGPTDADGCGIPRLRTTPWAHNRRGQPGNAEARDLP